MMLMMMTSMMMTMTTTMMLMMMTTMMTLRRKRRKRRKRRNQREDLPLAGQRIPRVVKRVRGNALTATGSVRTAMSMMSVMSAVDGKLV